MDPLIKLYFERAENEIVLSEMIFKVSSDEKQKEFLKIGKDFTFYSAVINHSYYSIFYCAKAYLLSKGIKVKMPKEHKNAYRAFANFVKRGIVDKELLKIYEDAMIKADSLLQIFKAEKGKRGLFTYEKLPQANKQPAFESLENAKKFFKSVYNITSV
jgi:uncharacterized protein (UPF0332 family)